MSGEIFSKKLLTIISRITGRREVRWLSLMKLESWYSYLLPLLNKSTMKMQSCQSQIQ